MKRKSAGRWILLAVIAATFIALYLTGARDYLTLEYLKGQLSGYQEAIRENPVRSIGIFFAVYVVTTALSFPGAAVLTLLAGALFGLWGGTIIVSFASSIGATLAFLATRFILAESVNKKFGAKLKEVNEGLARDGAFYLLTLRLVPAFPFFVVNLVMGLTRISVVKFYLFSQIGMLPGTVVFVNAGQQLSELDSLSGILSPSLLGAFVLLGLFPLFVKAALAWLSARKVYRGYKKPSKFDYNMIAIGAGSGGLVTAYIGAAVKAKVALIEKHKMGGDCLNTGCVPSKAIIRSARFVSDIGRASELGMASASVEIDFAKVMERVQNVITKIEPHDSVERYSGLGVECIQGEAKILSPWEVSVNGKVLTTKTMTIATGARPRVPAIPGLEQVPYVTSDTIWNIRTQPKRLLVVGGGPIGCELAQAFASLKSQVTLIDGGKRICPREDADVSELLAGVFAKQGIKVLSNIKIKSFEKVNGVAAVVLEDNGHSVRIEFDLVLLAIGREANIKEFGLEELGIESTPQGTLKVDSFMRTKYPNIYAVGDVTGPYQLTHAAAHQAWFAAVNSLFSPFKKFRIDYRVLPWATYTTPEIARVGLSEDEAKEKGIAYEITKYELDDLDRAIADSAEEGFVKVLTEPGKDKILGACIVADHASDMLPEFVTAMKYNLGLNKILGTIHSYPTMTEANKYAAGVWKKNHAPQGLLEFVKKFHAWRRN